ncbi:MAG: transglycosylase [Candidatus Saccharibacteria bacterium]|nr:transglycosylase [Candidatus Saccharibacteria bacterium]
MSIILYIIFGALVGWIASIIMGRNAEQGAIGNIVVGIVGAFLGGWIMQAFGSSGVNGFNLRSFLVALLGAVVLLFLFNLFRRSTRHPAA